MKLTTHLLDQITGHRDYGLRKDALARVVNEVSPGIHDLRAPHELAQFLAQVLHESARLRHVREIWGPTPAQSRYEGRSDLGNTQPGDGYRYMGRDIIQITGRSNYTHLTQWLRGNVQNAPDFVADPEKLEAPEYLGWGALWYWSSRVPARYIEEGDVEMITRRVNGGLNGLEDRLDLYHRSALVLLGYGPTDVPGFQQDAGLKVDGVAGPRTRAEMHTRLRWSVSLDVPTLPNQPDPTPAPTTPVPTTLPTNRPNLRRGDRGAFVLDLQDQLKRIGCFLGALDGKFGRLTEAAVLQFQANAGIYTDGIVGPATWAALRDATPMEKRDVSEQDLRERGSRTIANADRGQQAVTFAGAAGALGIGAEALTTASGIAAQAETALGRLQGLVLAYWPALLLIGVAGVVWWYFRDIKRARVDDAQSGRNVGR